MASATAPLPTTGGVLDAKVTVHPTPACTSSGNDLRGCRFGHDFGVDAMPLDEMVEGGPHGGRAQWRHQALAVDRGIVTVVRVLSRWPSGTRTTLGSPRTGAASEIGGHLRSPGEAEVGASVPNEVHDGIGGRGESTRTTTSG